MTTCPMCAEDVAASDRACRHCGSTLVATLPKESPAQPRRRRGLFLSIAGAGIVLASALAHLLVNGRSHGTKSSTEVVATRPTPAEVRETGHGRWCCCQDSKGAAGLSDEKQCAASAGTCAPSFTNECNNDFLAQSAGEARLAADQGCPSGDRHDCDDDRVPFGTDPDDHDPKVTQAKSAQPTTGLTVDAVRALVAAQASSITTTSSAFVDTFDDGASAWLPDSLALAEGKAKIAARARAALGQPTRIEALAPTIGIDESIGWATSQWKVTTSAGGVITVRVTEVFVARPAGVRVVAASFSVAPLRVSSGLKLDEPALGDDYPDWIEPEGWLGSPAELAKHLRDDPATVLIGSDATEVATGPAAVQKLLVSWRKLQLSPIGGVQATEDDNYKIITAVLRTPGANPSVYQTLAVFTASGPERMYQLATAHYSTPQRK